MLTEFFDDATIDELLSLACASTEDSAARRWLESALAAARGKLERRLAATGATRVPQPSPAKHNAPLDKVERASDRLIAALEELRRHPHAHASFWRFQAFGPVYASEFERADVIPTLTNIRDAARKARVSRTGRPRNFRKQQIVDLALAFCARFSPKKPSNDVNNFFPPFALAARRRGFPAFWLRPAQPCDIWRICSVASPTVRPVIIRLAAGWCCSSLPCCSGRR